MTQTKLFGREPSLIIGFTGAVVAVLVGLNLSWLTAGAGVAVVALLTALVTAVTTRPVAPALYVGVVVAVAAVLSEYNFHLSEDLIAGVGGVVMASFALFGVRPQVAPKAEVASANRVQSRKASPKIL